MRTKGLFTRIINKLLYLFAITVIACAVLLSIVREITLFIPKYQDTIIAKLQQQFGVELKIKDISTSWYGLNLVIEAKDVKIFNSQEQYTPDIRADAISLDLDVINSLWQFKPIFNLMKFKGMQVIYSNNAQDSIEHKLELSTITPRELEEKSKFFNFIFSQNIIEITDSTIYLVDFADIKNLQTFNIHDLRLRNYNNQKYQFFTDLAYVDDAGKSNQFQVNITSYSPLFSVNKNALNADLYLNWQQGDLNTLSNFAHRFQLLQDDVNLEGKFNGEFWLKVAKNAVQQISAKLSSNNIQAQLGAQSIQFSIPDNFITWDRTRAGWDLKALLSKLSLLEGKDGATVANQAQGVQLSLSQQQAEYYVQLAAEQIGVNLTDKLRTLLAPWMSIQDINFSSQLQDVKFNTIVTHDLKLQAPRLAFNFSNFNANLGKTQPTVEHFAGAVDVDGPTHAIVTLNSQDSTVASGVLHNPVTMQHIVGTIDVTRKEGEWQLGSQNLHLANQDVDVDNVLSLELYDRGAPYINLFTKVNFIKAAAVHKYLPHQYLDSSVVDWFQRSLVDGESRSGTLEWRGKIDESFPYQDTADVFNAKINVANLNLDYYPGWPPINNIHGEVQFDKDNVRFNLFKGEIYKSRVTSCIGEILHLSSSEPVHLVLKGTVIGDAVDAKKFIDNSPIHAKLQELDQLDLDANINLKLSLDLPFSTKLDTKVAGEVLIKNGVLHNQELPFPLENIAAQVDFSDSGPLKFHKMKANFLKIPLAIAANSSEEGDLIFVAQGELDADKLNMPQYIKGQSKVEARIKLPSSPKRAKEVTIKSDLQGISSDLPAPLHKAARDKKFVKFSYDMQDSHASKWTLLATDLELNTDYKYFNKNLRNKLKSYIAVNANDDSLNVEVKKLAPEDWITVIKNFAQDDVSIHNSAFSMPKHLKIKAQHFKVDKLDLTNTTLAFDLSTPITSLKVLGPHAKGAISWDNEQNYKLNFDYVHLPDISIYQDNLSANSTVNIDAIPNLDVVVKDLSVPDLPLGRLTFKLTNNQQQLVLSDFMLMKQGLQIMLDGAWHASSSKPLTTLKGYIVTDSIHDNFSYFKFADELGGKGHVTFDLTLHDAPFNFKNFAKVNGKINLQVKDGTLYSIEPGLGRILNIFSLPALANHLRLNLRDIFTKGLAFNVLDGDFAIVNGVMSTSNLHLDSNSGKVIIAGNSNLSAQDYNLYVTVSPDLGATIPIAATIATGNPFIGLATFAAEKILRVDKLMEQHYHLTGSWSEPEMVAVG